MLRIDKMQKQKFMCREGGVIVLKPDCNALNSVNVLDSVLITKINIFDKINSCYILNNWLLKVH